MKAASDAAYAEYYATWSASTRRARSTWLWPRRRTCPSSSSPAAYHLDSEINHGIDKLICECGAVVISEDAVSELETKFPTHVLNQWTYHARLYAAAKFVADSGDKRINLVQMVSFGCGVDAITGDEVRSILEAGDYVLRLGTSSRDTQPCAVVRLEEEIQVAQLSPMGGEPGFVDWKPEAPVTAPAPQDVPVLSVEPGAYQPQPVPALPEIPQDVKELAESLSNEELAYVCLGGFQDEGSKSVIGSAGMQVVAPPVRPPTATRTRACRCWSWPMAPRACA